MTETALQSAILHLAALMPGVELWRNNSGFMVRHHGGKRRAIRYGLHNGKRQTGSSDLIGVVGGRFIALEVKVPGKVATAEQEAFMADVRAAGGFAAVVDSVEAMIVAIGLAQSGGVG